MKVSLTNPNPGVFFPWPDEPEGTENGITLRLVTPAKLAEIDKAVTKTKNIYRDGYTYVEKTVDEEKRARLVHDYSIVSWSGLEDGDGEEIECNAENKAHLMTNSMTFRVFVEKCTDQLTHDILDPHEEQVKN